MDAWKALKTTDSLQMLKKIDHGEEDHAENDEEKNRTRSVYIIVFWDGEYIREKIHKICDSFSG